MDFPPPNENPQSYLLEKVEMYFHPANRLGQFVPSKQIALVLADYKPEWNYLP